MAVINLDPVVTISELKPFNCDPPDRVLRTSVVLEKNPMYLIRIDKFNDREMAGLVEESNWSRPGAGSPESDNPFIVGSTPDIGRVSRAHSGYRIGD